MSDLVTLGETMGLLFAPEIGRLRDMPSLRLSIGGAESNVAIGTCRLGGTATWIGRVGADEFGELVLRTLRAEGVRPLAVVSTDAPTALMVRERRLPLLVRVSYYRRGSAGSMLSSADLDEEIVSSAGCLHVTGITVALSPSARQAVHDAIDVARAAGVPVSFDVNFRSKLWSVAEAAAELRALAMRSDLVFAGEDELVLITGDGGLDGARSLAGDGSREVVVKRGARGAQSVTGEGVHEQAAFPVVANDPVGAGDAFVAGYLTARREGRGAEERLSWACRVGAFAVTGYGDWEALPTRDDLDLMALEAGTTLR